MYFRHPFLDMLLKMIQSKPMQARLATSCKEHASSGLSLVDFDLPCLFSMSNKGCQKITAIPITGTGKTCSLVQSCNRTPN